MGKLELNKEYDHATIWQNLPLSKYNEEEYGCCFIGQHFLTFRTHYGKDDDLHSFVLTSTAEKYWIYKLIYKENG